MSKEDILRCYLPYSTSKLRDFSDLQALQTMGFRGEALASIAAISRMSIQTHDKITQTAYGIVVEGEQVLSQQPVAREKGTSITIERLFHSVPARKKFLASIAAEDRMMQLEIIRKAAVYPHVAFHYSHDDTEKIALPVQHSFERAITLFPKARPEDFKFYETQEGIPDGPTHQRCAVFMALGMPHIRLSTRKDIHTYINGRWVKDYSLIQAVEYAYSQISHERGYPRCVISLTLDPSLVDVNVHPAKKEVKILTQHELRRYILEGISTCFMKEQKSVPNIQDNTNTQKKQLPTPGYTETSSPPLSFVREPQYHKSRTPDTHHTPFSQKQYSLQESYESPGIHELHSPTKKLTEKSEKTSEHGLQFVGTVFDTFCLIEQAETLYLMDFHAAHESLIYYSLTHDPGSRKLLFGVSLVLDAHNMLVQHKVKEFAKLGIIIDVSGDETLLKEIPKNYPYSISQLANAIETCIDAEELSPAVFAKRACKHAIKAGQSIDKERSIWLFAQLQAKNLTRCPHGRPLYIRLSKSELYKMIGRT